MEADTYFIQGLFIVTMVVILGTLSSDLKATNVVLIITYFLLAALLYSLTVILWSGKQIGAMSSKQRLEVLAFSSLYCLSLALVSWWSHALRRSHIIFFLVVGLLLLIPPSWVILKKAVMKMKASLAERSQ